MAIGDDFSISTAGDIRHVSGSTNYTVLELHRWLQDLADDATAAGNDYMDITTPTPSERATDNIITLFSPYNIDDTAAEYLYDGSVTQLGGGTIYSGLVVVGTVVAGTELQITQDESIVTSHWGTGKNVDATANILNRVLVKTRDNGANIDGNRIIVWARELGDTYAEFSVTMGLGNNVAAIFTSDDLNNNSTTTAISGWSDITNTEGYQLYDLHQDDGTDEPYYAQWDYGARTAAQVYERTKWLQRRGSTSTLYGFTSNGALFRGITHQWDYDTQTSNFTETGVVAWGSRVTYTGQTANLTEGEYVSFSGGAVGKIVWMDDQGATGTLVIQKEPGSGTIGSAETILGLTSAGDGTTSVVTDETNTGGAARILAVDDNGATGTMWVQLISGTVPLNNYVLYQRGSTALDHGLVNGTATSRTISPAFIGTFTGSAFIGAFGIGVAPADGIAADQFFDLTNTLAQPPNNQTFTVFGLVSGDRVLVTNNNATNIDFTQRVTSGTLSTASEPSVTVTVAIPSDTPSTGWVRVETDAGRYHWAPYSSWTGSTFTFTSTEDFSGDIATSGNNLFIGYIDKQTATTEESFTAKYSSDRTMFIRVRNGTGDLIKTYQTTATFGSGGGSATASRIADD